MSGGELGEVILDVLLKELSAQLKVLHRVIVRKQGVEVGDEVLPVESSHLLVVEIDLRQELQVGVQVDRDVGDGRLVEQLHQVPVEPEVCRTLKEVVHGQRRRCYTNFL